MSNFCFPLKHKRKNNLSLTSAVIFYPTSLLRFMKTSPKSCPCSPSPILLFPFSFKQLQSGFYSHHFSKTAFAKVTNDLHVTTFYGSPSTPHLTWPSTPCWSLAPSWYIFLIWLLRYHTPHSSGFPLTSMDNPHLLYLPPAPDLLMSECSVLSALLYLYALPWRSRPI